MKDIKSSDIYSKLRELALYIEISVRRFKKCDKYGIGSEMKFISEDLLCELSFFNDKSDEEKLKFLK